MSDQEKIALINKSTVIYHGQDFDKYFGNLCNDVFGADMMKAIYDMDHPDEISLTE